MLRRSFLRLMGAASVAPLVPALPGAAAPAAAAGYNRYMYGLAVFHARTRASITAADLMTRLRVSGPVAKAMIGEMSASGVVSPALHSGAMRALGVGSVGPSPKSPALARDLKDLAVKVSEHVSETAAPDPGDTDIAHDQTRTEATA